MRTTDAAPVVPTTPPAPRVMRQSALEGLLRGLDIAPDSRSMRDVLLLCGGRGQMPEEIPVEAFSSVLDYLARTCFPLLSRSEALFQVGAHLFLGYRKTLLGQLQLAALHLLGPERLMRAAPEFVGRNSNFGERTSEQLAPRHWVLHFRGVPLPGDYYHGLLFQALRSAGVEAPQTRWEQLAPDDMRFEARWAD